MSVLKYTCKSILKILGWSLSISKDFDINYPRQIVVYPHTSGFDLILASLFKYSYPEYFSNTIMIARHVFFSNRFNSAIFRALGFSPVNNNKKNGYVNSTSELLKEKKSYKFIISPEGSRFYRDTFRTGYYYIAKNTKSKLAIAGLDYNTHTINFDYLIDPLDTPQETEILLKKIFSFYPPLYPKETSYYRRIKDTSACNYTYIITFILFVCILVYFITFMRRK